MSNKTNPSFADSTFSLAKGLHHINIAKQYFEDVRMGTFGDVKAIFNQYILKCEWVINNVTHRLKDENKKAIEKELKESMTFEAINDKLILLDNKQRDYVEKLIEAIINGDKINVEKEKNNNLAKKNEK